MISSANVKMTVMIITLSSIWVNHALLLVTAGLNYECEDIAYTNPLTLASIDNENDEQ